MRRHWHNVAISVTSLVLGFGLLSPAGRAQVTTLDLSIKQPSPLSTEAEEYLLSSINTERLMAGLPAVKLDPKLQAAAHSHAAEMARTATLSHRLEGEPDLSTRGSAAGARFSRITENVAVGPSAVSMHGALMQSPHHRENILDSQVNSIGISVVQLDGSFWAVEDFSHSVEQLSLDEQEASVSAALRDIKVQAMPSLAARATCGLAAGYVGSRPAFTMRYSTGDLTRLPEQLRARMLSSGVRAAAVGACAAPSEKGSFTSYNIAVVVYR